MNLLPLGIQPGVAVILAGLVTGAVLMLIDVYFECRATRKWRK